jgi:phage shock protein C
MIQNILDFFEKQAFGVCASLADWFGLKARSVRLSFIYLSFLTFGSPIFVYLILAFWKKNRFAIGNQRRSRIFE